MNKTWKDYFKDFLGHPLYLFIFTLVVSLIFSMFPQGMIQFLAVLALGSFWVIAAILYATTKRNWALYESLPGSIKYHQVIKEVRILNEKGDAKIKFFVEGENLGDYPLEELFHEMREYDSTDFLPDKVEGTINGDRIEVSVDSMSKTKKNQTKPSKYESKFYFKFPHPVHKRSPLPVHSFTVLIPGYCRNAFENPDKTVHSIDVLTDNLTIKVLTERNIAITNWDFSVDDFHRHPDDRERDRIKKEYLPTLEGGKELTWVIENPRITDRYVLSFKLEAKQPL